MNSTFTLSREKSNKETTVPADARNAAKAALFSIGHYSRHLRADRFPGVAVMCYHGVRDNAWPSGKMCMQGLHVLASELDAHCAVARKSCNPIGLDDWRAALKGEKPLPPRPVLFTFDDGYRTVLTLALPILKKHGIPAAVFVCSQPVRERTMLWTDRAALAHGEEHVEAMKTLSCEEWDRRRLQEMQRIADENPHALLTMDELRAIAANPLIEIGGHTETHPILSRARMERQREEILVNQTALQEWTGKPVRAFAYPNGRPGIDYAPETVRILRESGFDFAFTTRPGFSEAGEHALERSRFLMLAGISSAELSHRLAYSWRKQKKA